jgi:polysaccharide pyruvyl transferase WcaK-like protein
MKVLVAWADERSTNLGVRALAVGAANLVELAVPGASVEYQSFGEGAAPTPVRERALVRASFGEKTYQRWLQQYDLVLDMRAGDSFADIYGVRRLISMNAFQKQAKRAGTRVIFGPQTIGPFNTRLGRALAVSALRSSDGIVVRDNHSATRTAELGSFVPVLGTDVVFAIPVPTVKRADIVALNVSGLLWNENSHVDYVKYRKLNIELVKTLRAAGLSVKLFAHVLDSADSDNDVPAVKAAAVECGLSNTDVFVPKDLEDVRQFLASCKFVIGARMHACLNALSVGTPAISLAYSVKFQPLLEDIGWRNNYDLNDESISLNSVLSRVRSDYTAELASMQNIVQRKLTVASDYLRSELTETAAAHEA